MSIKNIMDKYSSFSGKPFLTIIIPTSNSAATITNALESIVNQTYNNIEILIIDNLSEDNTVEISKQYQIQFPRIRICSEADKGIYDAMNKGISIAAGEWLYFLGSDDTLYDLNIISKIKRISEKNKVDIIYGNVYSFLTKNIYDGEFTILKLSTKNICHQAIFFKKDVFDSIGKFDIRYKALADWDNNLKWFLNKKLSKIYINEVIANFAAGGYSSIYNDEEFYNKKDLLIICRSWRIIPLSQLLKISNHSIKPVNRGKDIIINFYLTIINYYLKALNKLNNMFEKTSRK